MGKKNITAICGSTRTHSSNHALLKAVQELTKEEFIITIFEGLSALPHFNPDIKEEEIADTVIQFKKLLNDADGIIICTPEYAHGVPGTLKNAIDWTVSSCEFSQKPTLLITASTEGQYGHQALIETLRVIEAKDIDELNLLIPFVRTKINTRNEITDEKTLLEIKKLIKNFNASIADKSSEPVSH